MSEGIVNMGGTMKVTGCAVGDGATVVINTSDKKDDEKPAKDAKK